MAEVNIELTDPQFRLVTSEYKFPAFVGGYGSGKTHALITRSLTMKLQYPTCNSAYYLPTFDLVRTIAFPRFAEQLDTMKLRHTFNKTFATLDIRNAGTVIFRTMDNPERIIGYEVADSCIDEIDTLKTEDARNVWNKALGRNRQKKPDGKPNTMAVGTTPEGFRFTYERWKKNGDLSKGYELIQAPTRSNAANLPEGYIESLEDTYSSNLLAAYLEGEFVNLTTGSVYTEFDRKFHHTSEEIRPGEPLHIGIDFNVGHMSAAVCVQRNGLPRQLYEFTGILDTPSLILEIQSKFPGHMIMCYPDSSGKSRRSADASKSDIALLRQARFNVLINTMNPGVKDRVLSLNRMLRNNGLGTVKNFMINTDNCPATTEALEKQAYDKQGEPDKSTGFDHPVDALGYYICDKFPIRALGMTRLQIVGL